VVNKFMNRRSDAEGLKQFAFHVSFILLAQYLVHCTSSAFWAVNVAAKVFAGYTISSLFQGMHECVHHTAFKSPAANDFVANLFGFFCFRPPLHYRYYHWPHHRFTGDRNKDPELQNTFIDLDVSKSLVNYIAFLSGIPFWIDRATAFCRHSAVFVVDNVLSIKMSKRMRSLLLPEYYLQRRRCRRGVALEAVVFLSVYFVVAMSVDSGLLWAHWICPSLIGQVFLRIYLVAEHMECASGHNMFSNTRSTTTNWIHCKLAWNMPYHLEHHAFPYVPFFLLPEIHDLVVEHCGGNEAFFERSGCAPNGQNGYLSIHKKLINELLPKFWALD